MSKSLKLAIWAVGGCILGSLTSAMVTYASNTDPSAVVVAIMHLAIVGSFVGLWLGMVVMSGDEEETVSTVASETSSPDDSRELTHATA